MDKLSGQADLPDTLADVCVRPGCVLRAAIACMDRNGKGIVLIVDAQRKLKGTLTDGDVRRAVLAGCSLDSKVEDVLARKRGGAEPLTARVGTPTAQLLRLIKEKGVRQLPLLDRDQRVVGLVTMDDLLPAAEPPLRAVIMAGGKGTRLLPYTEEVPKPMLPVGERPLMEHIVLQLREAGIRHVRVAVQHLPEKIRGHFGNGEKFGVEVTYLEEDEPLGTGGALGLLEPWDEPLLVVNGDVLTQVNYRAMLVFHEDHRADMTVAVSRYQVGVPFGVLECDGAEVRALAEKPTYGFLVNAGIYLLEPSVRPHIPSRRRFDMTDLILALLRDGRRVVSFPVLEYWLDVGNPLDYEKAKRDIHRMRRP